MSAPLSDREIAALMQIRLGEGLRPDQLAASERLADLGLIVLSSGVLSMTQSGNLRCVEEAFRRGFPGRENWREI